MKKQKMEFNNLFCVCLILGMVSFAHSQVEQNQQQLANNQPLLSDPSQAFLNNSPSIMSIFGNNQCRLPPTPKKLAIATVTRFRATGQNDLQQGIWFFKQYLTKYATMQCDVFDSIYLIWNNEEAPEEYPMLLIGKEKWKKNVYFIQTKFNSMDHRFAFPPWVPEEVFMSLDDDADIDCQNMRKSFTQWQDHFVGGLGPFGAVQMSSRTMEYKLSQDKFEYKYSTRSYISMALPNMGIIPRHFYDLYYANLPQFQKMRNLVTEFSNCDDIGLNFMIGYIYPQIRLIAFKDIDANIKPFKIQINKTPTHGQKRNDCLNKFSQILGENTWSYSVIDRKDENERLKQDPLRKYQCLLALKRSIIQQKYVNNDHYYKFMKNIYYYNSTQMSDQLLSQINSDRYVFSLTEEVREELVRSGKIDLRYKPRHGVEEMFGKEQVISGGQVKDNSMLQSKDYRQIKQQNKVLVSNVNALQDQFQSLKTTLIVGNILVIIVIISVVVILKLIQNFRSKSNQKMRGQMRLQSFTTELQSVGQTARITEMK